MKLVDWFGFAYPALFLLSQEACKYACPCIWVYLYTLFFYLNHDYKNVEAQITPKIKNIVVILLVAISISFPASDEI